MNKKYVIGVDFGSLSGRAMLVEVDTGVEVTMAVKEYTHAVMDQYIPGNTIKLEPDWALQHPNDWLEVFAETIPAVLKQSQISAEDVIGVGVDFTACTVMPTDKEGIPLCFKEELKLIPHSHPKLWKHHAAQDEANRLNEIALDPLLNCTHVAELHQKMIS